MEPFAEAIEHVVDECIKEGILAGFLQKNRAEVISVSIFEYDEEKHIQQERDEAMEEGERLGREEGERLGREEGERLGREEERERMNMLNKCLIADNRIEELRHSIEDKEYQERLMQEYGIKYRR